MILSAKDGKILARLPLAGSSDGAMFNPATMEAFSSQGNGTMTIIKEKSPTSFEVVQNLKTWPSNGARTLAFDSEDGPSVRDGIGGGAAATAATGRRSATGRRAGWPRPWRHSGVVHDHHDRHQVGRERERLIKLLTRPVRLVRRPRIGAAADSVRIR